VPDAISLSRRFAAVLRCGDPREANATGSKGIAQPDAAIECDGHRGAVPGCTARRSPADQ
jgi:hypothetical protein